jgi:hypothetical protein
MPLRRLCPAGKFPEGYKGATYMIYLPGLKLSMTAIDTAPFLLKYFFMLFEQYN